MEREYLKVLALVFAAVSLASLTLAAFAWNYSGKESSKPPSERSRTRGNLILIAISLALVGGLWLLGGSVGWGRDRVLWVGFGAFLTVMTLTRPWWFWENYRARWLREVMGDEATAALYLALAGVMVWVGFFTDWAFGARR